MKALAIFLILLTLLSIAHSAKGYNRKAEQTQDTQTHKSGETKPSIPSVSNQGENNCPPTTQKQEPQTTSGQKAAHDWIDKLNAVSTAVIAAFTIGLFATVFYQVKNLRDVERAWLVVDSWTAPPVLTHFEFDKAQSLKLKIRLKNLGRTPARIKNSCLVMRLTDRFPKPATFPQNAQTPDVTLDGLLVVPNETVGTEIDLTDTTGRDILLQPGDLLDIRRRDEIVLCFYGFVEYLDTFNRKHILRFCYIYEPVKAANHWTNSGFRIGGPKEYNSHT